MARTCYIHRYGSWEATYDLRHQFAVWLVSVVLESQSIKSDFAIIPSNLCFCREHFLKLDKIQWEKELILLPKVCVHKFLKDVRE